MIDLLRYFLINSHFLLILRLSRIHASDRPELWEIRIEFHFGVSEHRQGITQLDCFELAIRMG